MKKKIVKEYTAFAANGAKTWGNNEPYISLVTSEDNRWVSLDLTIEEAEQAIVILQEAIQEAKNLPDHFFDDNDTPF
jgi:hypothetical protein